MPPAIKKHFQNTCPSAEVLAIQALDDIVGDLIKANKCSVAPSFLDWVNLNATGLVLDRLEKTASKDHLWDTADSDNAGASMRRLVSAWVMPHICQQFSKLSASREMLQAGDCGNSRMREIDFVV